MNTLISKLLTLNPKNRPSAEEILTYHINNKNNMMTMKKSNSNPDLLKTIKVTYDLNAVKFPKPMYKDCLNKENNRFINNINNKDNKDNVNLINNRSPLVNKLNYMNKPNTPMLNVNNAAIYNRNNARSPDLRNYKDNNVQNYDKKIDNRGKGIVNNSCEYNNNRYNHQNYNRI